MNSCQLSESQSCELLTTLILGGCVVYYPKYHYHFSLMDAKLSKNSFVGVYSGVESEEDVILFTFDSVFLAPHGIYFQEDGKFKSYCLSMEACFIGNELKTEHMKMEQARMTPENCELKDIIFKKYS